MSHHVPVPVWAAASAAVPAFRSVLIVVQSWWVVRGRLKRNENFGIRTPSTMRSDQAWMAGHRAALRLAPWFLLLTAAVCASVAAVAVDQSITFVVLVGVVGVAAALPLSSYAAVIASRAARSADSEADGSIAQHPVDGSDNEVTLVTRVAASKTVGVVAAVAVAALTGWLLYSSVQGYTAASHHQLRPNTSFGFRDATALSGLPAWYAAQKVGFSWLLIGGAPILIANILVTGAAAIKRRPPGDILAFSLLAVVLLGIVVVIAGVHAQNAAGAITVSR